MVDGVARLAGPKVVAFGGGHGLAASLSALRRISGRLTAVVTVADDGGSSGRLRRELGVLPPGDLRMALAALCGDDEWGRTWARVLQHRFESGGELHNHAAGNLLIVALWELLAGSTGEAGGQGEAAADGAAAADGVAAAGTGHWVRGLDWVARLLGAQGRVLPMCAVPLEIEALVAGPRTPGGGREITTVHGQHAVATATGTVVAVRLVPENPPACPEALDAIADADWLVFGPGSWFSSVIPHLLVPDLKDAIVASRARVMVALNLSAEGGETEGFTPEMHLEVLASYAPDLAVDVVVADRGSVPDPALLDRITSELGATLLIRDIAMGDGTPRHHPERLAHAYARAFEHGSINAWP
ncbi:MAG TPA: 2-phospho-L-lactate transferase CofD family protein [Jiangellaceae bacterium]